MKRAAAAGGTIAFISIAAIGVVFAGTACGLVLGWLNSSPNLARERSMSADAVPTSASAAIGALTAAPVGGETTGTIRPAAPAAGSAAVLAPAPAAAPKLAAPVCVNPNAMGVARVVEIDTTGGPGFGFQHFKSYDFLNDHEVVLTFDDGPWLGHTPAVLKALPTNACGQRFSRSASTRPITRKFSKGSSPPAIRSAATLGPTPTCKRW
jgi:hypothetical protein